LHLLFSSFFFFLLFAAAWKWSNSSAWPQFIFVSKLHGDM
jgi:hypothetical protein